MRGRWGHPTLDTLQQSIRSAKPDVAVEVRNRVVRSYAQKYIIGSRWKISRAC
jgi:hypothetical protein